MKLLANGKINLGLNVAGKREDGFHELDMVMQSLELADEIEIERIGRKGVLSESDSERGNYGISIKLSGKFSEGIPEDGRNLAYKAAESLLREFSIKEDLSIHLIKNIPFGAGLGGGSADAAAVLRGVNKLFSLGLDFEGLRKRAEALGSDVPFCIRGGTCRVRGRGEIFTDIEPTWAGRTILLAKPQKHASTGKIYGAFDELPEKDRVHPDMEGVVRSLENGDDAGLSKYLDNSLEKVTLALIPEIGVLKALLKETGAIGSLMSGSGSTVFGIFSDIDPAEKARDRILQGWSQRHDGKLALIITKSCGRIDE